MGNTVHMEWLKEQPNMLQGLGFVKCTLYAAKGHCSVTMIICLVNYSAHKLSVTKVNFLALVATLIVSVPIYSGLKGCIHNTII